MRFHQYGTTNANAASDAASDAATDAGTSTQRFFGKAPLLSAKFSCESVVSSRHSTCACFEHQIVDC